MSPSGTAAHGGVAPAGGADVTSWLQYIQRTGVAFNTPEWAAVVRDCYGFEDCTVHSGAASLPLFYSWSPLFGRKLVSAVFNSYASPVYDSVDECRELLRMAVATALARRVSLLEVKSLYPLPSALVEELRLIERRRYRTTLIDLDAHRSDLSGYSANFRSHLRRAYARVARAEVSIARTTALADVRSFHDVMLRHYRDNHSMIGQPRRLFEIMHERLILAGKGDLWVAKTADGVVIGGILFVTTPTIATGAFGASNASYRHLSIDAVMKDVTLRFYAERGFALYDLGISSPKQEALLFAKSRFRGMTFDIPYYYRLVEGGHVPEIDFADAYLGLRRLFRWVPMPLVRRLSPLVVRYLN